MHDDWRAIALTVLQADPVTFKPNHACTLLIPVLILPMVSAYSGFSFLRRYWLIICGLHVETVLSRRYSSKVSVCFLRQSGAEALVGHLHVALLAAFGSPHYGS